MEIIINDKKLVKNKRKRIMIISSDSEEICKHIIINRILDNHKEIKKNKIINNEICIQYKFETKIFNLVFTESSGYEQSSRIILLNEISKSDGIIFIFSKYSHESLDYINEFIKKYHLTIGNKFFPCVFVQNETIYSNTNYSTIITKNDISELTMNLTFPIVKIKDNFNKKETDKMIDKILVELKKEKKDEFPYSLAYHDKLKINFCIRNNKLFTLVNILIFFSIMLLTIVDTIFIINNQDFQNETRKIDDLFLGIRLNIDAINFISVLVFTKYSLFDKEKFLKIQRLEKYVMIINLISFCIQMLLHLRIKHVKI